MWSVPELYELAQTSLTMDAANPDVTRRFVKYNLSLQRLPVIPSWDPLI